MTHRWFVPIVLLPVVTGFSDALRADAAVALAGFAETDITPPVGIDLGGRGCSNESSNAIVDPLFAQAAVLQDARGHTLVFVSLDLIGLSRPCGDALRAEIAGKLHTPAENVILNCSHTHSGPMMYRDVLAACGPPKDIERKYMEELAAKVVAMCAAAADRLAPVMVRVFQGKSDIGIDRRGRNERGEPAMVPNPAGPRDPTVWILRLDSPGGEPRGILFSYACHPVTVYGCARRSISADYPGAARRELRAALGRGVHVQFFQGAAGNIRPRVAADLKALKFRPGTLADKDTVGRQLATAVLDAFKGQGRTLSLEIAATMTRIDLARGTPPDRSVYERIAASGHDHQAAAARYWLEQYDKGGPTQETVSWTLGVVRLAPDQWICYFSGEPVVQWVSLVRRWFGDRPVAVFGYTQEAFGYLPVDEI
ncbi:MAG: neutral/alkaline non-lysosomal ceramidase N-terminal domain-containing protein, partial [Phycisphaerae bacterium]